jgi:adenylosuccinate synthase
MMRSGFAVTKLDVLSGLKKLKIATRYQVAGEEWRHMPENIRKARQAEPVYEEMAGWEGELTAAQSLDDLPQAAREYLRRLEDLTGVAPAIVSIGPGREQTLMLRNPFQR